MATDQSRIRSLDLLRGLTISAMILINNPGSFDFIWPPLAHSEWHGWTFADLVFPAFLFLMGVALPVSTKKRMKAGASRGEIFSHGLIRAGLLFMIGLFINAFPFGLFSHEFSLGSLRIMGVLQRIAICYLFALVLYLFLSSRTLLAMIPSILLGYYLLLRFVPVPGYGAGVLDQEGNLVWYIDSILLSGHTWLFASVEGFDPEGLLSTFPAVASTLIGVQVGGWLLSQNSKLEKIALLLVTGVGLIILAEILKYVMPINKNLWTSTYVLLSSGWVISLLGILMWFEFNKMLPRIQFGQAQMGRNALALFILSECLAMLMWSVAWNTDTGKFYTLHDFIYLKLLAPGLGNQLGSLAYGLLNLGLLVLVAVWLDQRRIYLKL
ncbi:MAG: heparan-alpha-glucosaminide N-acetyltransferase domain-containing protein [Candidatus Marinimicrobia bacterium]|nr:heparan-alpha-glucosaminide N-acetyltransferase domain-containing protein [Candidatus Neomarinimicrobiota bacterium]MCF7850944.1 heparan-alpha-glucosaminide N-acetyltransferase domain-containing protein [Candidatus Neomarinimicrobiota bacterium]